MTHPEESAEAEALREENRILRRLVRALLREVGVDTAKLFKFCEVDKQLAEFIRDLLGN